MNKFKVGDRVRCIEGYLSAYYPASRLEYGNHYTVADVSLHATIRVGDKRSGWWGDCRFELVKEAQVNTPHKHAAIIKAWADGAQVQVKNDLGDWYDCKGEIAPCWRADFEYRIKPKYDRVVGWSLVNGHELGRLKFTIDEDGVIKSVELINKD